MEREIVLSQLGEMQQFVRDIDRLGRLVYKQLQDPEIEKDLAGPEARLFVNALYTQLQTARDCLADVAGETFAPWEPPCGCDWFN